MSLLWLLEQSFGAAMLVVLGSFSSLYGGALLVVLLLSILVSYRGNELIASTPPRASTLGLLALAPFVMLILGTVFSADTSVSARIPETSTLEAVLHGLLVLQMLFVVIALWRFRSRLLLASGVAIPLLLWTIGAWAVAGMAITGNWI